MKLGIFYFSGTGNTEIVASKWFFEAKKQGIDASLIKIEEENFNLNQVSEFDKIAFAYPVHAFNAPENVWRYALKFPNVTKKIPVFFIMVSGEYLSMNHSSYKKLMHILKKKGFVFESEYHYLMPYNMIFRHTEKRAFEMYEAMENIIPLDVKEYLVDGKTHRLRHVYPSGWFIALLRIEQWFSGVNGKHFKINSNKCIKCMKCVNNCPTKNIKFVDGKFKFENRCLLCTRCSFNCPVDAFSIALLNGWRVNKPYAFKKPEIEEKDRHSWYCKNSYKRYFREIENRLKTH